MKASARKREALNTNIESKAPSRQKKLGNEKRGEKKWILTAF